MRGEREKSSPCPIPIRELRLEGNAEDNLQLLFGKNLVGVPESITYCFETAALAVEAECVWVKGVEDDGRSNTDVEV